MLIFGEMKVLHSRKWSYIFNERFWFGSFHLFPFEKPDLRSKFSLVKGHRLVNFLPVSLAAASVLPDTMDAKESMGLSVILPLFSSTLCSLPCFQLQVESDSFPVQTTKQTQSPKTCATPNWHWSTLFRAEINDIRDVGIGKTRRISSTENFELVPTS